MSINEEPGTLPARGNARAAAQKYREKLERLAGLMAQANAVWATVDPASRDVLTRLQSYDASLANCLLKGEQAARELFGLAKGKR